MKIWYSIKASAADVAEVTIYDEIGFWGINASRFLGDLAAVKAATVKLFINSPGGSVIDALAIFNGLRQSGKRVEVKVMGVAASAASYIAMAGDHISMPENTMMFLHNPIAGVYGNAEEMRDTANTLDKFAASLTATYAKRFKGDLEALNVIMANETWLTAAECLEYGLCDEVTAAIEVKAQFDLDRDFPEQVKALLASTKPVEPPAPVVVPPVPTPAAAATPHAEQIAALTAEHGLQSLTPALLVNPAIKTVDDARAVVGNAVEVRALLTVLNKADRLDEFALTAYADVRAAVATEMAAEDESKPTKTAPPKDSTAPAAATGLKVHDLWAKIRKLEKPQ